MNVNGKKYFDDVTFEEAARLIKEAKLTPIEICKKLHTTLPTLKSNMDTYFNSTALRFDVSEREKVDWLQSYKAKLKITKRKKNTRIVYECQSCSSESKVKIDQCSKCGSLCVRKRELRNKVSPGELRAIKMIGRRKKI